MRLSQIIAEADDHVNYDGLDQSIIERLSKYKPHQQQWAVKELRNGSDVNSVVDALDYYITKIGDNRFQNILKSKSPTPKNILSLSLDNIKAAQHDFEVQFNKLSKRERNRLRSNVLLDIPGLKVVEFKKKLAINGRRDRKADFMLWRTERKEAAVREDTDTAKALAAAAQFTKWCVVNTETGNYYLDQGPLYLITMGEAVYEVVVPGGQPVAINQYLCHVASEQLRDVRDQKKLLPERVCLKLREYIAGVGIFCNNKNSDVYADAIKHNPRLAYDYACNVIKGRLLEAEPHIISERDYVVRYASDVIKGRWPEVEPTIIKDPWFAYYYARDVIKGRWPEAEPTIIKDRNCAYIYADQVIKGRWPEAEPAIMQDTSCAYEYAIHVIKGRWPEAEQTIKKDNYYWRKYQEFLQYRTVYSEL